MRKITIGCFLLLFSASIGHRAIAQDQAKSTETAKTSEMPAHYYHLDFVVQELGSDGKPSNSRTYTTTVSTEATRLSEIRTNSKVPITTASFTDTKSSLVNTQFQYEDVGVNIDVNHAHEAGRGLALEVMADVSSIAPSGNAQLNEPVIRQNRWQSVVLVPIGKATVIFTSDALDSKGSMQVLVTATPLS
ncbi:MAG TPA: hypothetical protein VKR52_20100 [Terracidiphilus sp.]|nr:hypothetical protein [Terracidiphilus sp.]